MKIIKNYILNSAYQLLVIIFPIITLPYITRVIGPTGIGINNFTIAIVSYFMLVANLGISLYGNREIAYNRDNFERKSIIFWELFIFRVVTTSISLLAFIIFLYFQKENRIFFIVQGVTIIAAAFDISWYFMGVEKFKITLFRSFILNLILAFCIFVFVRDSSDLLLYVAILPVTTLVTNLMLWTFMKNEISKFNISKLRLKRHIKPSIALFVPTITGTISFMLNKNLIGILDGMESVAFFSMSDSMIRALCALVTSLGTVMLPYVANLHSKGDKDGIKDLLIKSFNSMSGIAIPLMFGIIAISRNFAPFFFGEHFRYVGLLMMLQSPVILFISWSNSIGVQYLLPTNKVRSYNRSVIIGVVFVIVGNFTLIPLIGVAGSVVSMLMAELSIVIYQLYSIRNDISLIKLTENIWKYLVAGSLMFVVVFIMNSYSMSLVSLLLQVITGVTVYVISSVLLKTDLYIMIKNNVLKTSN